MRLFLCMKKLYMLTSIATPAPNSDIIDASSTFMVCNQGMPCLACRRAVAVAFDAFDAEYAQRIQV